MFAGAEGMLPGEPGGEEARLLSGLRDQPW